MFPLVYVCVRQWEAWKLHLYNSIAQRHIFLIIKNFAQSAQFGICWIKFAVMMAMLVVFNDNNVYQITTNWVSQHHYHWKLWLLSPTHTMVNKRNTNPNSFFSPWGEGTGWLLLVGQQAYTDDPLHLLNLSTQPHHWPEATVRVS